MTRLLSICAATLLLGATVGLHGQNYPQYPPVQSAPYPPADNGAPYGAPYGNQGGPTAGEESADQQHGAARVSLMHGDVNVQRGEGSQLVAAIANAPLLTHDRLQTGQVSSAEVQLDGSNVLRLAQNTDVGFADLQYGRAQIQLGTGTVLYRMLRPSSMQVEIDTPSVGVSPVGPADLRIEVLGDGTTRVTIRSGTAEMFGPQGSQRLEGERSVLVRGDSSNPEFQDAPLPPLDVLDSWSAQRDQQLLASPSYQYTGADVAGGQDLDANGSWVPSAEYGQVWEPTATPAGWAPYSEGQWVYEPYYGWTWVDAAPWGWAPYHYGRWFLNGGRGWCWWPGGGFGARHVWGPAFVGFFGFGGGGLGWVALAPHEGFHAWWGGGGWRGGGYGGFAGGGSVLSSYRNAGFRGGFVTASVNSFGGPRTRFSLGSRDVLSRATLINGRLPVTPSSSAYRFSDRQAVANPRLSAAAGQRFFQRGQASSNFGGSYRAQPNGRSAAPAAQYRQTPAQTGWQHFGDPRATSSYRQSYSAGTSGNGESGWHQFGRPDRYPAPGSQSRYGAAGQRYQAPAQQRTFSAPAGGQQNRYQPAPQPRYQAPAQQYQPSAQQRYQTPAQPRYQSPVQQPRSQSAPQQQRYQAPAQQHGGGGGNYSGGGQRAGDGGGGHQQSHSQGSSSGGHEGHHR